MSTQLEEQLNAITSDIEIASLVVYNDNVNTFQHVIACLIKYCYHSPLQAEQCAHIIHHNGKCQVKLGYYEKLKPIRDALADKGLKVKIE